MPAAMPAYSMRVASISPLARFARMHSHPHPLWRIYISVGDFAATIVQANAPDCPSFFSPEPSDAPYILYPLSLKCGHSSVAIGIRDFIASGTMLISLAFCTLSIMETGFTSTTSASFGKCLFSMSSFIFRSL